MSASSLLSFELNFVKPEKLPLYNKIRINVKETKVCINESND